MATAMHNWKPLDKFLLTVIFIMTPRKEVCAVKPPVNFRNPLLKGILVIMYDFLNA